MNEFSDLYQRYLDDRLNAAEKAEFLKRIGAGGDLKQAMDERIAATPKSKIPERTLSEDLKVKMVQGILNTAQKEAVVMPLYRRKIFQAVAASLLVLALVLVWYPRKPSTELADTNAVSVPQLTERKERVDLPDGTTAFLNVGSSLFYDEETFGKTSREVTLIGEAYFDVTHDPTRPFKVHSSGVMVTVLGTAFNVNAYPENENVAVTVARGLVEVSDEKRNEVYAKIRPNEQIIVHVPTSNYDLRKVNADEVLKWKKNFLLLDKVTLPQLAEILDKRYNVTLVFRPELAKCEIVGTFLNDEPLDYVLKSVSKVLSMKYEIKNDTVVIEGNACF
jgi:transmembrane sensor